MYFIQLHYQNANLLKNGAFHIDARERQIPKWTILSSGRKNLELMRLLTLALAQPRYSRHLGYPFGLLSSDPRYPVALAFIVFHHHEANSPSGLHHQLVGSALKVHKNGVIDRIRKGESDLLPPSRIRYSRIRPANVPAFRFFLAYGPRFSAHDQTDDVDFADPLHGMRRFHTMFHAGAPLTDPVAFLKELHYKGVHHKRIASRAIMHTLCDALNALLKVDTAPLIALDGDPEAAWHRFPPAIQRSLIPLLDICRHLRDAFPRGVDPLKQPGVILFHRPDLFCTPKVLPPWLALMDAVLPNMQFILTLGEQARRRFHSDLRSRQLPLAEAEPPEPEHKAPRLPRSPILLIDIDSRLPNLALMKLSRYFRDQGKPVLLARKSARIRQAEAIFASSIFNSDLSARRVAAVRDYYGKSAEIGGSGVDLRLRLPDAVENLPADYSLYPELKERAIGFVTRGCPHHCRFCVVPVKEGAPRQVCDLSTLMGKTRTRLILLDDNLLSWNGAVRVLEEMAARGLKVNFTQTLDLRHVDREKAHLLRRIQCMNTRFTRSNYHFSLNDSHNLERIREKYDLFEFTRRDNVCFICMYGYNTTLRQDVERFRFLRSLPGAYVFVQRYRPIRQEDPAHPPPPFFDADADRLIDALVSIVFTQNMRSMETYYKWVSRAYVLQFGKLHDGLVNAIFRYNDRHRRGEYIATLAGTRKGGARPAR